MNFNFLKVDWRTNQYISSGTIEIIEYCNSITVTNTGADIVTVNGQVLNPGTPGTSLGDSLTIGLNYGEVFSNKRLSVSFQTTVDPEITVIQKHYIVQ